MHEAVTMRRSSIMKCLLRGIEDEGGMCGPTDTPADDTPCKRFGVPAVSCCFLFIPP